MMQMMQIAFLASPPLKNPTQPQKTFHPCTLLPHHVSTTQLAPSTKAGFRNITFVSYTPPQVSALENLKGAASIRIVSCQASGVVRSRFVVCQHQVEEAVLF